MNRLLLLALCVSALTLSGCVGHIPSPLDVLDVSGAVRLKGKNASLTVGFSNDDRRYVQSFYGSKKKKKKHKKTPPGLAKRGNLPPGLRKQVQRNGQLPPGLQGRGLPGDLEGRLSRLPDGYIRLIVEKDLVLMNKRTGVVVDVMLDVVL